MKLKLAQFSTNTLFALVGLIGVERVEHLVLRLRRRSSFYPGSDREVPKEILQAEFSLHARPLSE